VNTNDLLVELNKIYSCVDGPPRPWFELPTDMHHPADAQRFGPDVEVRETPAIRIVYETVRVAMRGGTEDVGEILCRWVWRKLRDLLPEEMAMDASVVLFWRRRPSIEEFLDKKGRVCSQLRMRLAIPGYSLGELAAPNSEEPRWL
jgi:hypothetical protein